MNYIFRVRVAAFLAAVAVLSLVAACGRGDEGASASGDSVTLVFNGGILDDASLVNRNPGLERCRFYDGVVATGDRVVLTGPDGDAVGVAQLTAHPIFRESLDDPGVTTGVCLWEAKFENLDVNQSAYMVEVVGYGSVTVSPDELKRKPHMLIRLRSPFDVMAGNDVLEVAEPAK